MISGALNINKPEGWTSMDVVRLVKRLTRQRRVGHGGALDPQATGVLPILLGQATRLMEYVVNAPKLYRAQIVLGKATDTYDRQGKVVREGDPSHLTRQDIEEALASFRGLIYQVPPMYSALKHQGRRLYDLARAGEEVPRSPRRVVVSRLDLLEWQCPTITVEIECHRGVYIRSLANDIGEALGCGGHLGPLTRLRAGPFPLESALTVEELRTLAQEGRWQEYLFPTDALVLHLRAAVVGPTGEAYIQNGQAVGFPIPRLTTLRPETCRIYTADGHFLALAQYQRGRHQWHPIKVFPREGAKGEKWQNRQDKG